MQPLLRDGQHVYLDSRLPEARRPLLLSREIGAENVGPHGYSVLIRGSDLLERTFVPPSPPTIHVLHDGVDDGVTAGFEAVYRRQLSRQGIESASFPPSGIGRFAPLPPAVGVGLQAATEFVGRHDRGIITVPTGLRALVVKALVHSFPQAPITVLASSRDEQRRICERFAGIDLPCNHLDGSGSTRVMHERLSIGLPGDLAGYGRRFSDRLTGAVGEDGEIGLEHTRLCILWNARNAAQSAFQQALLSLNHARLFGFSPLDAKSSPLVSDRLVGTFGLDHFKFFDRNSLLRRVEYLLLPHANPNANARGNGHTPLWRNPARNRRLVSVARGLAQGTSVPSPVAQSGPRRVLLVAGLPGQFELLRQHRSVRPLEHSDCGFGLLTVGPGKVGLLLADDVKFFDLSAIDAVVWAGAGYEGFNIDERLLAVRSATTPLLLIDLRDQGHGRWRHESNLRVESYRSRDWFCVGEDALTARIERFLAQPGRRGQA